MWSLLGGRPLELKTSKLLGEDVHPSTLKSKQEREQLRWNGDGGDDVNEVTMYIRMLKLKDAN